MITESKFESSQFGRPGFIFVVVNKKRQCSSMRLRVNHQ